MALVIKARFLVMIDIRSCHQPRPKDHILPVQCTFCPKGHLTKQYGFFLNQISSLGCCAFKDTYARKARQYFTFTLTHHIV